jgi:hypothetical protein
MDHSSVHVTCSPNGYDPKGLWPSRKTSSKPGQMTGSTDLVQDSSGFEDGTIWGATLRGGTAWICGAWRADSESDGTLTQWIRT